MLNSNVSDKKKEVEVIDNLPINKPVIGHFDMVPFLLTSEMFGGLGFEMVGKEISSMIGDSVASLHEHEYPEIYLLISPNPGNATIEIETPDKIYKMTSPSVAHIPAKLKHRFIVKKAEKGSYCFGLLLTNKKFK